MNMLVILILSQQCPCATRLNSVFHILFCLCCLQYAVENEELTQHLGAAKDAQRQLTAEVRQSTTR